MDEQAKEFETINAEPNQKSTTKKGISKTTKLVLIINATLIAIIVFVVLLDIILYIR